jgi:hypothetical protein
MKTPKLNKMDLAFNKAVDEAFPKIYKNMSEYAFSNGSFSLIDVIDYVLETAGSSTVYLSSWVASQASINHMIDFFEDQAKINDFHFLLDPMFKSKQEQLYNLIKTHYPGKITEMSNHAKFTVIFNENWNFVIETSANLNKNRRLENFRITEDLNYCYNFKLIFETIQKEAAAGKKIKDIDLNGLELREL